MLYSGKYIKTHSNTSPESLGLDFITSPLQLPETSTSIQFIFPVGKKGNPIPDYYEDYGQDNREIIVYDRYNDRSWSSYRNFDQTLGEQIYTGKITQQIAINLIFDLVKSRKKLTRIKNIMQIKYDTLLLYFLVQY